MDTLGNLVKDANPDVGGANVTVLITDKSYTMDYMDVTLSKSGALRILGKALHIGYTSFEVYLADTNTIVMSVDEDGIHLNTDIFGK